MSETLNELYQDLIRDHQKNPRAFGLLPLKEPLCRNESFNPLCGDHLKAALYPLEGDDHKTVLRFEGSSCAMCMASASLLAERLNCLDSSEIGVFFNNIFCLLESPTTQQLDMLGKISILQTVKNYPSRVKCVTLSWHLFYSLYQQQGVLNT